MCICICVQVPMDLLEVVTVDCEPLDMGDENWAQILYKSSKIS